MSSTAMDPRAGLMGEAERIVEERLQVLAEMLVYGASRREALEMAQQKWGVSRRTAQAYLQRVQQQLAREAADEDRLFHLRLSQLQRDKLVGLALRYAHDKREQLDPHVLQSLSAIITAVRGLLDSRDRAAGEIHQLVSERLRQAVGTVDQAGDAPGLPESPPQVNPAPQPDSAPVPDAGATGIRNGSLLTDSPARIDSPTPPPRRFRADVPGVEPVARKFNHDNDLKEDDSIEDVLEPACAGCATGTELSSS